jgi:hypothetical protein
MGAAMAEALTKQIQQAAIAAVRGTPAFFGTVPGEDATRRMRIARFAANAISALCAVLGVLVVSIAAVVLGLT